MSIVINGYLEKTTDDRIAHVRLCVVVVVFYSIHDLLRLLYEFVVISAQ